MSAATRVDLGTLVRLRLELVRSRLVDTPPWHLAVFGTGVVAAFTVSVTILPMAVPVFAPVDPGLIVGGLALLLAATGVFGIHLLVAEGADPTPHGRAVDPLELLPVSPTWTFYLVVLEEALTDPVAWLAVPPLVLGVALAAGSLWLSVPVFLIVCPLMLAVLAAARIVVERAARVWLTPRQARAAVRGLTYVFLIGTVAIGGGLLYDVYLVGKQADLSIAPQNLVSAQLGLPVYLWACDHRLALSLLPTSWPVQALLVGAGWPIWLLATVLGAVAFLALLAAVFARLETWPQCEPPRPPDSASPPWLVKLITRWFPVGHPAHVALETDMSWLRGEMAEAMLESGLLAGSLLLTLDVAPQTAPRTLVDGVRFLLGFLTLLLTTPAAAIAREGPGLTLRRSLPSGPEELLLSKLPFIILRNVVLVAPSCFVLCVILPIPSWTTLVAAGFLVGIVCVVGALATVGAGMVAAPLTDGQARFAPQVLALVICGLTLSPITLVAAMVDVPTAAAAVLACGIMIAGLWQKSLARIDLLSDPPAGRRRGSLLGDSALGALLYFLLGTTLASILQRDFPGLGPDGGQLLAVLALQIMTIRYAGEYLLVRLRTLGEPLALAGKPGQWLGGLALGVVGGLTTLLYAYVLTEYLDVDPRSGGSALTRLAVGGAHHPILAGLALVSATVLAPVSEEILFRRLLFAGLREAVGRFLPAALISALGFALAHPPAGFPVILGVGLASAWLFERHGTLAPSIALHVGFNGLQMALLLVKGAP